MLQTHIPWLADGYRVKLQQEEQQRLDTVRPDNRDNFTLCPEEHIKSYAELRIHSKPGSKPGFPQRRVLSAHGRLGDRGQTVGRAGKKGGGEGVEQGVYLTDEDKENHPWLSSTRRTLHSRPSSAKIHTPSPRKLHSALAGCRDRGQADNRPSSAFASYRARSRDNTRPWSALASYRTRAGKTRPTSANPAPSSPSEEVAGRHGGGGRHGDGEGARPRPVSASAASPGRGVQSPDPQTVYHQRIQSARQAWADDPRSGLHIGGPSPGPAVFMDRHARCLDHTHIPDPSLWDRPHTACGGEEWEDQPRPDSALSTDSASPHGRAPRDHMSRLQRYVDCHRPQTAPTTRKELGGTTRAKFRVQGRVPHFCNFVHSIALHERYNDSGGGGGRGSSNSDDDDERLGSLLTDPTDKDLLAQWRKQSRFASSGTEGRPGSPSSMVDGHGLHLTDANALNNRDVTGSHERDEDALSLKMIPTITIPSSPIPPHDPGAGTQRSSGEESPRKSAREKREPIRQPMLERAKPKPLPASTPSSAQAQETHSDSAKGKRQPAAKKTKKGSDRKRKGKSSGMEDAQAPPDTFGEMPNGEAAAEQPPVPSVEVDIKVPDLPSLPTSGRDQKSAHKGEKRPISTRQGVGEAKPQLPSELLELNQRVAYDFGDMEDTVNEITKPKFRSGSWINNRMALSQQSSRFELPMDMKSLEKMTTQDYLKKYCIVTSRRLHLYQKIFMKHKDKSGHITRSGLETCLKEVLIETLRETTLVDLCDVLEIADDTLIDFKLFSGVAAIAERILYPYYTTEDTLERAEYQREKIETADFGALDWKLNGIHISDHMRKLLKMIQ